MLSYKKHCFLTCLNSSLLVFASELIAKLVCVPVEALIVRTWANIAAWFMLHVFQILYSGNCICLCYFWNCSSFISVQYVILVCLCLIAVCWVQCQNGGVCQRPNTCSCPEGWMGRFCEERKSFKCTNTGSEHKFQTAFLRMLLKMFQQLSNSISTLCPQKSPWMRWDFA